MGARDGMVVKAYGRPIDDDGSGDPLTMAEVTLIAEPDALRALARFLETCASEMREPGWNHEHFERSVHGQGVEIDCDLIVFNPSALARKR